jgi:hypothetical protein
MGQRKVQQKIYVRIPENCASSQCIWGGFGAEKSNIFAVEFAGIATP